MAGAKASAEGKAVALSVAAGKLSHADTRDAQTEALAYLRSKQSEYLRMAASMKSPAMEVQRSAYVGRAAGTQLAADHLEQALAKPLRAPKRRKPADEDQHEAQQASTGEDAQQGADGEPAEADEAP